MSAFIRIGNDIINFEQVCKAEYRQFDEQDASLLGAKSILYIYTADGSQAKFKDADADLWWDTLDASALAVRY